MARRRPLDRDQLLAEVALRLSKARERAGDNPHALVREIFRGAGGKLDWRGEILGVQPRIRLTRSFDQRFHTYLGYTLQVQGSIGGESKTFLVGVGKEAQAKYRFEEGLNVRGECEPVGDPRLETVDYYKATRIEVDARRTADPPAPPPWHGVAPELPVYRARGHRRLSTQTYMAHCTSCIWGAHMAVEMIIDQWNPPRREYRTETFCYGPKSCPRYRPGPKRVVPGRKGMRYTEEDWVDEEAIRHRGLDE